MATYDAAAANLKGGSGGLVGTRTQDQRLKRPLLYRLSYQPNRKLQNLMGQGCRVK
jgi:hypothetical protein